MCLVGRYSLNTTRPTTMLYHFIPSNISAIGVTDKTSCIRMRMPNVVLGLPTLVAGPILFRISDLPACDFRLVITTNLHPISHRFQIIATVN